MCPDCKTARVKVGPASWLTASGSSLHAYTRASARVSRPSASVFPTCNGPGDGGISPAAETSTTSPKAPGSDCSSLRPSTLNMPGVPASLEGPSGQLVVASPLHRCRVRPCLTNPRTRFTCSSEPRSNRGRQSSHGCFPTRLSIMVLPLTTTTSRSPPTRPGFQFVYLPLQPRTPSHHLFANKPVLARVLGFLPQSSCRWLP
jgi:hypothetical protein